MPGRLEAETMIARDLGGGKERTGDGTGAGRRTTGAILVGTHCEMQA